MSQQTRTVLKTYFETGDKPTEAEFIDLIDSLANLVDDVLLVGGDAGVVANPGGGQPGATQLVKRVNNVITVASPNDSVKLPTCAVGKECFVLNTAINNLHVYPNTGDNIYPLAVNNPQTLVTNEMWHYIGVDSQTWRVASVP